MHTVTTIGFDIAKSVFQVHGVDAAGQVIIRRQFKRRFVLAFFQKVSPCLVGLRVVPPTKKVTMNLSIEMARAKSDPVATARLLAAIEAGARAI